MSEKFWILQNIQELLERMGVGAGFSALVTFLTACAILIGIVWFIDFIGTRVFMRALHVFIKRSATQWDDFLYQRRFFNRLIRLIAVIAVPANQAQAAADMLVKCGIRGIWNFAPKNLRVPDDVVMQRTDLAASFAVLSIMLRRKYQEETQGEEAPQIPSAMR